MVYSEIRQPGRAFSKDCDLRPSLISLEELITKVHHTPYDISIPQESLDLANKFRTSLFPWRGQFSPELVEILLDRYSQPGDVILDPFVGSGTTLFEAVRKGLRCYGVEINPSAIEMAKTAQFANIALNERKTIIRTVEALVERCLCPFNEGLFFSQAENDGQSLDFTSSQEKIFRNLVQDTSKDFFIQNFIINIIIRYMNYRSPCIPKDFFRAVQEHARIVESIPLSKEECKVLHCDARSITLADDSIDLIITSPPYINVFNYHQNNRPAMELIGWNLLDIAKSEIGSNRKNRQNRFLTVIQYALDMLDALIEMRRLLKPAGRAIIVIGKESSIRGVSLRNGMLVALLALGGAGFHLESLQKRKFVNKFGETIYEDILHLTPDPHSFVHGSNVAKSLAIWSLDQAVSSDKQVNLEILSAKKRADLVQKSPLFGISAMSDSKMISQQERKSI